MSKLVVKDQFRVTPILPKKFPPSVVSFPTFSKVVTIAEGSRFSSSGICGYRAAAPSAVILTRVMLLPEYLPKVESVR
ncbi:hypothetical protein FQZ97_969780 [compost metagenome]